jgi:manganese transport protein
VPTLRHALFAVVALGRGLGLPQIATAPFCPSEVSGSVAMPRDAGFWQRLRLSLGPGLLVAVGYMDPGNWTTNLQGGAAFGGGLAAVVAVSGLVAIGFQLLAARLGLATGTDLAVAARRRWGHGVAFTLWVAMELAIVATDVAEVLGAAVALEILFGLPILVGIVVTSLDVFLVLGLKGAGFRRLEAITLALVVLVATAIAVDLVLVGGPLGETLRQAARPLDALAAPDGTLLALGIVGATLMPHNLFLHSSVVCTRRDGDVARASRWATLDTVLTLGLAIFVNLGLLALAATAFHAHGLTAMADLQDASRALADGDGGRTAARIAADLFAVGLLASGLSSTFTGTIVGQVVLEGFLELKIPCWLRRIVTRGLALVPALCGVAMLGEAGVGDLLEGSQVTLALLLPLALIPLILLSGDRRLMGPLAAGGPVRAVAWILCLCLIAANAVLILRG